MKVSTRTTFTRGAGSTDPVNRFAARIHHAHYRLGWMALAQACPDDPLDLIARHARHVDVQQKWPINRPADIALNEFARNLCRHVDVLEASVEQRKSDGGYAEQITFHRRRNGARINGVIAHVLTVVDARNDQVWHLVQQPCQRDVHAITRRAIDKSKPIFGPT